MGFERQKQAGNIFFALFAATAMVGIVGAGLNSVIRGPATSVSNITRQNMAENNMLMASRLAVVASSTQQADDGDCDADGYVEPLPYRSAGAAPKPTGGGYLPLTMGATVTDPWNTEYGYCVWDHGDKSLPDNVAACGGSGALRLKGAPAAVANANHVIAIISAGKDRLFQTSCNAYVDTTPANGIADTPLVNKPAGSDDIVFKYTYGEAIKAGDGLWSLKEDEPETATIDKDIEVEGAAAIGGPLALGGGLILPDQDDPGAEDCNEANDDQLRRNTESGSTKLEICVWDGVSGDGSAGTWEAISGAGGLPTGAVVAFNQSSCPSGWIEVTDLAGRVIIGVGTGGGGTYALGATGGAATVTLTEAQMPAHTHDVNPASFNATAQSAGAHTHSVSGSTTTDGSHTHSWTSPQGSYTLKDGAEKNAIWHHNQAATITGGGHGHNIAGTAASAGAHTHIVPVDVPNTTSTSKGGGAAHENRQPYRAYVYCESAGTPVEGVTLPTCTTGQSLQWNGTAWTCVTGGGDLWTLHANNTDIFRAAGKVGIGNSGPSYDLDVISSSVIAAQIAGTNASNAYLQIRNSANGAAGLSFSNSSLAYLRFTGSQLDTFVGGGGATDRKMSILSSGNVGIGSGPPAEKLDVDGNVRTTGRYIVNNAVPTILLQDTDHRSALLIADSNFFTLLTGAGNNSTTAAINGSYWPFTVNLTNDNITFGGNVTFAEGSLSVSAGDLSVSGNMTASAYYQSSDRNLKTDIDTITDPFALLSGIEGKHFLWRDSGKAAYGVIAQDVAAVMPEAVSKNGHGDMTVEYNQLIGPLIEAVKQLKSEIKELRADNDNLREEIRGLKEGSH